MTALRSSPVVHQLRPVLRAVPEPPDPTDGRLVVDTSCSALSPHLRGHRVAVNVDGYPLRFAWGRTTIDLPAGRHSVEIEVENTGGWGRVVDAVPVAAGHTVEVFYRAPALPRLEGALGPQAQGTRGAAVCVTMGLLAVLVLAVAVMVLLGATGLLG